MRVWSALLVLVACGHPANTLSDGSLFGSADAGYSTADGPPDGPYSTADGGADSAPDAPGSSPDAIHDGLVAIDAAIDSPVNSGPPPTTQIFNVWPLVANPGAT